MCVRGVRGGESDEGEEGQGEGRERRRSRRILSSRYLGLHAWYVEEMITPAPDWGDRYSSESPAVDTLDYSEHRHPTTVSSDFNSPPPPPPPPLLAELVSSSPKANLNQLLLFFCRDRHEKIHQFSSPLNIR